MTISVEIVTQSGEKIRHKNRQLIIGALYYSNIITVFIHGHMVRAWSCILARVDTRSDRATRTFEGLLDPRLHILYYYSVNIENFLHLFSWLKVVFTSYKDPRSSASICFQNKGEGLRVKFNISSLSCENCVPCGIETWIDIILVFPSS